MLLLLLVLLLVLLLLLSSSLFSLSSLSLLFFKRSIGPRVEGTSGARLRGVPAADVERPGRNLEAGGGACLSYTPFSSLKDHSFFPSLAPSSLPLLILLFSPLIGGCAAWALKHGVFMATKHVPTLDVTRQLRVLYEYALCAMGTVICGLGKLSLLWL